MLNVGVLAVASMAVYQLDKFIMYNKELISSEKARNLNNKLQK
ncbi:hypothetical protein GCM10023314_24780 [Algibacter agarivorans]|uniref:Uncharacterized protein n=1 Tax=Algibacter agarivorans TaxID=1109741 RepID=A0ABP9GQA4_9FLAO